MAAEHERWLERSAIYALGALDGDELNDFQAHLGADCAICKSYLHETVRYRFATVSEALSSKHIHEHDHARPSFRPIACCLLPSKSFSGAECPLR
jgi:hypothetical protein